MKHESPMSDDFGDMSPAPAAPSADYINAISQFLDTDPSDLLFELGYYERSRNEQVDHQLAEMNAQQE